METPEDLLSEIEELETELDALFLENDRLRQGLSKVLMLSECFWEGDDLLRKFKNRIWAIARDSLSDPREENEE